MPDQNSRLTGSDAPRCNHKRASRRWNGFAMCVNSELCSARTIRIWRYSGHMSALVGGVVVGRAQRQRGGLQRVSVAHGAVEVYTPTPDILTDHRQVGRRDRHVFNKPRRGRVRSVAPSQRYML